MAFLLLQVGMEIESIRKLHADGVSCEDIASGMGLEVGYVKGILGDGAELTDSDERELKDILMDIARGRMNGCNIESQLGAATYLHKTRVDEKGRNRGLKDGNREVIMLLREKASQRMKAYEIDMIQEAVEV